jgi:hypothetical protein
MILFTPHPRRFGVTPIPDPSPVKGEGRFVARTMKPFAHS